MSSLGWQHRALLGAWAKLAQRRGHSAFQSQTHASSLASTNHRLRARGSTENFSSGHTTSFCLDVSCTQRGPS